MKTINIAIALLILVLPSCRKKEATIVKLPLVETVFPVQKTVPIYVDVPGHIEPIHKVDIKPQVNGEITGIFYEEGTYVEEGSLLVTIDERPYIADLNKAEGMLVQKKAELQYAKDTMVRNEPLVMDDFISKEKFEQLVTNMESIEGAILTTLAEIQAAQINVDFCKIAAPISGMLGERRIDMGNIVTAYSDETLVTIKQIAPIWVNFGIDEGYLYAIQQERKKHPIEVIVYHKVPSNIISSGRLVFINNQINEKTGQILMRGEFVNQDHRLWPGEYVRVRLIIRKQPNAILLPAECIQQSQKGSYVFVVNDSQIAEKRSVKLGLRQDDGKSVVILDGLSPHEQVISKGQINVASGVKVDIKKKDSSQQEKSKTEGASLK